MTRKYNLILGITVVAINFISPQAEDSCAKQNSALFPEHKGTCPKSLEYVKNISCQIYNMVNLNCTWDMKTDAQYCFVLRNKSIVLPCSQYLTNEENQTIGCHVKDVVFHDQRIIRLQFSNTKCQIKKHVKLSDIEIMKPPINITIQSETGKVIMTWNRPPTGTQIVNIECFEYELKVLETETDVPFRIVTTDKREHTLYDLDKDKKYSIHIRGRKMKNCGQSKSWGEWSEPLFVGEDKKTTPSWIYLLTCIIAVVFILVISIYLIKRYATAVIPDPSSKLKFWFSSDLHFQKCAVPAQNECVPITEIEIVISSVDSSH
ncbi:interleukin-5 receptor subunit alpha isoform X2 [Xenopus laevis]|nr:interleukin-5 receptor subunit alpha isoform X2 [Xenopus laevis]OCT91069.1 hypothetical protein XELAEV_18014123mg [Xenopus laevis]